MIIYKNENDHSEHFRIIHYPDGQRNVVIDPDRLNIKEGVTINCRIKSFSDLEILSCLINSLKRNDYYIIDIEFVYLFGIRSDRAFTQYESSYFKEVICPIINDWNIRFMRLRWPFEPLAISQFHANHNIFFFADHLSTPYIPGEKLIIGGDETVKCFHGMVVKKTFSKKRDIDGKLFNFELEDFETDCDTILIVDDLCDGGATFIEEAKILKKRFPNKKLELYIYHGLFTKGVECLLEHFDKIYCTNSYQDISHPKIEQFKVI